MIELARPLEQRSPLAAARLQRRLTVDEAARRAGITADEAAWLEDARLYRFAGADEALLAAVLYATALGVEHREARELAGLPVPPRPLERNSRGRLAVLGALVFAALALAGALLVPARLAAGEEQESAVEEQALAQLPDRWEIAVSVLNGAGDINWTRQVASRIGALAYHIEHVGRADRFDYARTAVYYPPGGKLVAVRLARELGVVTKPLPGGDDPRRLVVVVGPQKGPGL